MTDDIMLKNYKRDLEKVCRDIAKVHEAPDMATLGAELIDAVAFKMERPTDQYRIEHDDGDSQYVLRADMDAFRIDDGFFVVFELERYVDGFTLRFIETRASL